MSGSAFRRRALGAAALGVAAFVPSASAAVVGAEVVEYRPGTAQNFTNPSAALGLPAGDTTFGALTPFNPPFRDNHIVIAGAGGGITLRLSAPVQSVAGPELGVFVNNGIIDVSPGGTGTAGNPAGTFSPAPAALVSVSGDGTTYVPLGAAPVVFSNPTNFYTDVHIDNYSAPLGNQVADFAKPFSGSLASFNGLTYEQMLTLLDGSGGGNWVDISPSGLPEVRYVRFEVPAGTDLRLVLDAVTAVPEPSAVVVMLVPLALSLRRRRATR